MSQSQAPAEELDRIENDIHRKLSTREVCEFIYKQELAIKQLQEERAWILSKVGIDDSGVFFSRTKSDKKSKLWLSYHVEHKDSSMYEKEEAKKEILMGEDKDYCEDCGQSLKHSPKPLTGLCKDCDT